MTLWKHKKLHKGKLFIAGYEYGKNGKRIVKFKNVINGKELSAKYTSLIDAKKNGWLKND